MKLSTALKFSAFFLLVVSATLPAEAGKIMDVTWVETLSGGEIDRLVRELFTDVEAPKARYAVDSYLVHVESTYLDGKPTPVTLQLFIPRYSSKAKRTLYIFAPGSTGIRDACRPSREHIAGIRWGQYRTHALAHAGQGSIAAVPDYMGFGDPDPAHLQPYFVAVAEGRALLDCIRATQRFITRESIHGITGTSVFVAGYSQGGHAAFAAADLRPRYARDVRIDGIIGYGPSTDVPTLFREWSLAAPMAIYSYSKVYGKSRIDPERILAPRWAATLEKDMKRLCIGGMQSYYPSDPRQIFKPEFAEALLNGGLGKSYPVVDKILRENSTGLSGHRVPALILEGSNDVVVHPRSQEKFAQALCRARSPVKYVFYKGSRHDTRQVGFLEARAWMDRILRGERPESNCEGIK